MKKAVNRLILVGRFLAPMGKDKLNVPYNIQAGLTPARKKG
jgi:hypothetical protein